MRVKKMYCRYFKSDIQLEKFIEYNAITAQEIFSISPIAVYQGNGNYSEGHYLYFFTERNLLVDLFNCLPDSRQNQIRAKIKNLLFDENSREKILNDKSIKVLIEKRIFNNNIMSTDNKLKYLILHTEENNEPPDVIEFIKMIADINPYLVNFSLFVSPDYLK